MFKILIYDGINLNLGLLFYFNIRLSIDGAIENVFSRLTIFSRPDEQERGITMKSSAIALYYKIIRTIGAFTYSKTPIFL
jgi:translation elongation factor EF-G